MENPQTPERQSFKTLLESNTNLFTIFGIFNALGIWSSGFKDNEHFNWMSFVFFALSIMVWWEVVYSTWKLAQDNLKFTTFLGLIGIAQFGLIYYIYQTYQVIFVTLSLIAIMLSLSAGLWYAIMHIIFYIMSKTKKGLTKKNGQPIIFISMLLSFPLLYILMKFIVYLLETYTTYLDVLNK